MKLRIDLGRLLTSAIIGMTLALGPRAAARADLANPTSIDEFVACLNQGLQGTKAAIGDAVQCVPKGCKVLMTMSQASAQAA